ncbi:nucleotidyltransferase family protein [Thermosipho atlanticus]|uniref:Polymerase nucleotidyl transferase domain-containing protein n=1 Tax=Thermosipho atlanticus DSM 15807 TaxID=1123380 RepID=A0A1M5RLT3_9BACT|nr:nucleotidyltransferase family protein [Thermosipho atlanticus]SHH27282.1 hypothetical protein SAMN02745199_0497 [Thermosipho atlanticus DSM 15807]
MKTLNEILKVLETHKKEMQERFFVKEIGVFGSYVRGEQNEYSDVDILVEFTKPIDFFLFLDFEEYLSNLLGIKVDLVMKKTLKPRIERKIMKEIVHV